MATVNDKMTAIADAIRDKTDGTDALTLDGMAAEIPKVYEAGKASMVDESKLIPTVATGTYISVDDVSEIPHSVKCKISGVDALTNVQATRVGANLLSWSGGTFDSYKTFKFEPSLPEGTYTMHGLFESEDTTYNMSIRVMGIYTSDIAKWGWSKSNSKEQRTYTFTAKEPIDRIYLYTADGAANSIGVYVTASEVMLHHGSVALPYEPYTAQTSTPNADGTVEGITSVSPFMDVFTDTEGVNIEVEYNKSYGIQTEYDRFWDGYQDSGNRTNYHYAFAYVGWNDTTFKPKYNIVPKLANTIFIGSAIVDLMGKLKEQNVVLDFSQATDIGHLFQYAQIEAVGVIDTRASNKVNTITGENYAIKTIEKIIFRDEDDERGLQTMNNPLWGMGKVVDVVIEGIIGNSISCLYSGSLTKDCLLGKAATTEQIETGKNLFTVNGNVYYGGILGALKEFEAGSNTCTITLHATPKSLLSAAEIQAVSDRGWTIA